ncbi:hypothetical protein QYF36_000621 [Acer negundo]|nr:hypothetical protein QYF36_000621 [Acer negundo]
MHDKNLNKNFIWQITFDVMCNMLMSITDESLLQSIEKDVADVTDAMLSFPIMVPGAQYCRGMKAQKRLMKTFREMIDGRRSGVLECSD